MTGHDFNFAGGEILTPMGASWFVSYCYYCNIDKTHMNWNKVKTADTRKSSYRKGEPYHKFWLERVLEMDNKNLERGQKLQLKGNEVKKMAKELLNKIYG